MPVLYHRSQWTLRSILNTSFIEKNNKTSGNTCWHPHQLSLIRPKTQRLMHFPIYSYENHLRPMRTTSDTLCKSSPFGWGRRSLAAAACPSLEGEVSPSGPPEIFSSVWLRTAPRIVIPLLMHYWEGPKKSKFLALEKFLTTVILMKRSLDYFN